MSELKIRLATAEEAGVLGRHRSAMYQDMGLMPESADSELVPASEAFFREAIAGGRWFGWIASDGDAVVGGAVMHLDLMPPRNGRNGAVIPSSLQGLIMNVYVEPQWRRLGVASQLMDAMLAFAREQGAVSVTLHASQKGKQLYEKMGFLPTHEMRLFL